MEHFGKFILGLTLLIISIVLGGAVFYLLWNWLIVTSFDVKKLTFIQAIAVSFFVRTLQIRTSKTKVNKNEQVDIDEVIYSFIYEIQKNILNLLIAWIITLFM